MYLSSFPKLSETFIVNKFLGLLQKGWDVHVVCAESSTLEWEHFPVLDTNPQAHKRVHVRWPHRPRWLAALLIPAALVRCLLRKPTQTWQYLSLGFRRFGRDILRRLYLDSELILLEPVIIHYEFGALAVGRMYLKDLVETRISLSFRGHDLSFSGLENPDFYKEVWEHVDAIHLLGEDLWKQAQKRGCPPDLLHVFVPPSVDIASFEPDRCRDPAMVGTPERPLRILSVGRLVWSKGYEYALQAIKLLVGRGIACEYRIVGGGNLLEGISFARHQLNLEGIVNLLGPRSWEDVAEEMQWADVFLQASVQEGFCNAVVEAQAMMLPVVCSDAGGLPENVQHGVTGFVVPRRDPQAMAEKLAFLSTHPECREEMGKAGRSRVEQHFQLPVQIERFDQFYQDVLTDEC